MCVHTCRTCVPNAVENVNGMTDLKAPLPYQVESRCHTRCCTSFVKCYNLVIGWHLPMTACTLNIKHNFPIHRFISETSVASTHTHTYLGGGGCRCNKARVCAQGISMCIRFACSSVRSGIEIIGIAPSRSTVGSVI